MSMWIWLNEKDFSCPCVKKGCYCVAEFTREYSVSSGEQITLFASADVRYLLYVNDKLIGRGPITIGGDYNDNYKTSHFFVDKYTLTSDSDRLKIRMVVNSSITAMSELSSEEAGAFVKVYGESGFIGGTDESWLARPLTEYVSEHLTDYTQAPEKPHPVVALSSTRTIEISPLDHLDEKYILPTSLDKIDLKNNTGYAIFDKIYSAYPEITIKADARVRVSIECEELDGIGVYKESLLTDKDITFTSARLRSIGQIKITLDSEGATNASVESVRALSSVYPVKNQATLETSDLLLNKIYDLCIHTLTLCRRDLHLDSPTHQEPLACTGDYFIQALMEYYNMYDPTLTRLDILRTARMLKRQYGVMFHTTYSLIFVEWLYDYYKHTLDLSLVKECEDALNILMERFSAYVGSNGLIEYAPNYMFVDWILMDEDGNHTDPVNMMKHKDFEGYSLHHPPKALGQSVLCMLYYNALCKCIELYELTSNTINVLRSYNKRDDLKKAIIDNLYDKEKGLFVGGLNTPNQIPENDWLPKNTTKKFYLKQANILAVLYGLCPQGEEKRILEYVLNDLKKEEIQPYFYHFLLEALLKEGLFEKYGLDLIRRYKSLLDKCDKGLCEAWEMFPSDCSHAWGGTPAYILKKALSGFEMVEAGYKRVRIKPQLYDLDYARVDIPTPYGPIEIQITKSGYTLHAPDEIEIIEE